MKRNLLIAFVLLISIASCKKEKPPVPEVEDRKPEVILKEIAEKLSGADSISTFTAALKNISLTVDETAQGITVFAPLNLNHKPPGRVGKVASNGGSSGKTSFSSVSAVSDTTGTLTDAELKDHIVKGVFNFNNLTNGKVLTTLNGKELKITRSADTVWINGVRIGGQQIVSSNNEAVYSVKSILTGTTPTDEPQFTSLEITVYDATLWTTAKPKGELAANALVTLYHTQKDYADSVSAHMGTTDATGKVVFKSVQQGEYYIKVNHGVKSNIIYRSTKQNGLYLGFANSGIYQNQSEVEAGPSQAGAAPGDFKFLDSNADGVITDNDRVTIPYEKATVITGAVRKAEVLIGTLKNTQPQPFTESEFNTKLNEAEAGVALWHKKLVLIDGFLGPKMTMDSVPQVFKTAGYQAINTYGFNPSNQYIEEVWRLGYESISKLTTLTERIPNVIASRSEKMTRVRVTRAYVYLQLFTYFENISLLKPSGKLSNTNRAEVYDYILSEFQNSGSLPNSVTTSKDLNGLSKRALLAKVHLLNKQYADVKAMTESIIASGSYELADKGLEFAAGSREIMWDNSTNMDAQTKSYFYNRSSLPYLRLTEVYMMAIEANIALGQTSKAQELYAVICNRSGYFVSPVTIASLSGFFGQQFAREGNLFVSTLRWGNLSQLLPRGFIDGKHNRLPIPQSVLDANVDMRQNVQY